MDAMSICCDIVHVLVMTRACLFLYEGIKCPSLPQWAGLIISSHSNDIGSHVNATCGHVVGQGQTRFADSALFKLATCNSDGEWQPALPACVGKCCSHCLPTHTRMRVYYVICQLVLHVHMYMLCIVHVMHVNTAVFCSHV